MSTDDATEHPDVDRYRASDAWTYGWEKFTGNLGPMLLAVVALVGVEAVLLVVGYLASQTTACTPGLTRSGADFSTNSCGGLFSGQTFVLLGFLLLDWLVSLVVAAALVRGALDLVAGRRIEARRLLVLDALGDVVVAALIVGMLTFVGFVLFVIPGLLVLYFTSYTLFFLLDRNDLSPAGAITASFEFTRDHPGDVILWFLLSLVTWWVGLCLCGVGLIAAVPVIVIGTAYTYRTLSGQPVQP